MQSVEKDGEKKKKRMQDIISEDSVLAGEKGVDFLKKRCERQRLNCMSVDKKKISVWKLVGLVEQLVRWCSKKRRQAKWSQFVIMYCYAYDLVRMY